jgi:peptidoglycan lytic transglycosylase
MADMGGLERGGWLRLAALALALAAVTGCGHKRSVYQPPPPPTLPPPTTTQPQQPPETAEGNAPTTEIPAAPGMVVGVSQADLEFIDTHKPVLTEMGMASWYAAPYEGRRSADGQVFDGDAMTAANRTLPMGSLVVVTNLKTGQSGAMRITDRGPFIAGRILDLSKASAKAVGLYRDGIDRVRLDVYKTPKPIWSGGRWCVQIGAFTSERRANKLKKQLIRKYPLATVIDFPGAEHQYWVRIRPHDGDRETAVYLTRHIHPSEGVAFLTRLD